MKRRSKESYLIKGRNIETEVWTSPSRDKYWLLAGELVTKEEAVGLRKYRRKSYDLRRSAVKQNLLVDVGDFFLVTETLVFDCVSSVTSFVLGSSRSGNVAVRKKRALVGRNIESMQMETLAHVGLLKRSRNAGKRTVLFR